MSNLHFQLFMSGAPSQLQRAHPPMFRAHAKSISLLAVFLIGSRLLIRGVAIIMIREVSSERMKRFRSGNKKMIGRTIIKIETNKIEALPKRLTK